MAPRSGLFLLLGLLLILQLPVGYRAAESRKLFMMLVDGFRWDYFRLPGLELDGFSRLIESGVKAEYVIPGFPSNSFPNWRTIETGLHPESHGFVGNFMFDYDTGGFFDLGETERSLVPHWWKDAEAFYISAEKQGYRAALYHWRGCQVERAGGVAPSLCVPFTDAPTMAESRWAMSDGLQRLKNGSADIVYVYHQQVDKNGHLFGPDSPEVLQTVQELDRDINQLLENITDLGLDDTNVIVLSDHGMQAINHVIDISVILDMSEIHEIVEGGTQTYIWPKKGYKKKVLDRLRSFSPHYEVYDRSDIHDRWFLKKHRLMSPLLVVAEPGWFVKVPRQLIFADAPPRGNHGFDNDEENMRAMFVATGPSFKKNHVAKPFDIVNVYQMVCHVTGISPHPHNGTWDAVDDMMVTSTDPHSEL